MRISTPSADAHATSGHCARPHAMPAAAASQMEAAVVSPLTASSVCPRIIDPAPRNPMPVTMPWMTREVESEFVPLSSGGGQDEDRGAQRNESNGAEAGRLSSELAVETDDARPREPPPQAAVTRPRIRASPSRYCHTKKKGATKVAPYRFPFSVFLFLFSLQISLFLTNLPAVTLRRRTSRA